MAGVSFLAADIGGLELVGWAAAAYQYGMQAAHSYWVGAVPAMLFLGLVIMPFYYNSRTHLVPRYLKLRFGEPSPSRALSAVSCAGMTVLMSGIKVLAGTGSSIGMLVWVQVQPSALKTLALPPYAQPMAESLYRMLWSWLLCVVVVTIVVSLLTTPRPYSSLAGLVYGCTGNAADASYPLVQQPLFWAGAVHSLSVAAVAVPLGARRNYETRKRDANA